MVELEDRIVEVVRPVGSMTVSSIVESIDEPERDVKLTISDMIRDGKLSEHPNFEGSYVVDE